MPVHLKCPGCNAMLSMPESMHGKPVRCPTCTKIFQAPAPQSAIETAVPVVPAVPIAAPVAAPPAPAPDTPEEPSPLDFQGVSSGFAARRVGWGAVQQGLRSFFLSAGLQWFAVLLTFLAVQLEMAMDEMGFHVFVLMWTGSMVAGQVFGCLALRACVHTPGESGARGAATGALVMQGLGATCIMIASLLLWVGLLYSDDEGLRTLMMVFVAATTVALSVCWLLTAFYLVIAGVVLGSPSLTSQTMMFTVVLFLGPLLLALLAAALGVPLASRRSESESPTWVALLFFVFITVEIVWFCLLIARLNSAINTARRQRAA